LESFQRCAASIPLTKQFNFMGAAEPFLCPAATDIIEWSHKIGHSTNFSTTLFGTKKEYIDRLAEIPFNDTVIHVPANDGRMNLRVTPEWLDLFAYAIAKWRHHKEFVISCYSEPHPLLKPIWVRSGIPLVHYGLHDREGLVAWVGHQRNQGPLPNCSKLRCGHLFPNGDLCRCCGDYSFNNVWGNLFKMTFAEALDSPAWHQYMKDRQDETKNTPCRYCGDGYRQTNREDQCSTS
jgi:hypothetical protein